MRSRRQILLAMPATQLGISYTHAGTGSHESVENDGALDWAGDFEDRPPVAFLRATLARGTSGKPLESFDGESIIAAVEVVAASSGHPCKGFPQQLAPIVARSSLQFRALAPQAKAALAGVIGAKSELRESWSLRADDLARWTSSVKDLMARLSAPAANSASR